MILPPMTCCSYCISWKSLRFWTEDTETHTSLADKVNKKELCSETVDW